MNREYLEDILVDLEVLYNKLPPLAKAHINEAQRCIMDVIAYQGIWSVRDRMLDASLFVGRAAGCLA